MRSGRLSHAGPGPLAALLLGALLLAGSPAGAEAQTESCEFLEGTQNFNMITLAGGSRITYLSRPRIGCPDGVRIRADSAISYSAQDLTHLLGSVVFRDGTRELRADEARYFPSSGRLQAQGSTRLEDSADGSVVENGDLVLLRETDFRDRSELTATTGADGVRPTATLLIRPDTAVADSAVADSAAVPDSVALAADSAAAGGDSVAVAADSAGMADSIPAATDTLGALPDRPAEDSVSAAPDTAAPATDSLAAAEGEAPAPDSLAVSAEPATPPAPDSAAPPAPDTTPPTPYQVTADRLFFLGDGYFEAVGDAVIDRDSLRATSQRAEYDETVGSLLLEGGARLDGTAYDLEGRTIEMELPGGEIGRVTARRDALLTGEDLRLEAPVIHLFLVDELLDRLVAVPFDQAALDSLPSPESALSAQPVVTAEEFVLRADSVDVRAPRQRLDRIYAVGRARGVSMARDSLNVELLPTIARNDWLEGDTIIATFRPADRPAGPDSATSADASDEYVLDELVAAGSARSLYRLLPSDSTARPGVDPPAVHYVTGSRITIALLGGEVDRMEVDGPTQGWHLEPLQRRAASDSARAPGDTVPASDSTGVGAGGTPADTVGGVAGRGGAGPRGTGDRRAPAPGAPTPDAPGDEPRPEANRTRWDR